MKHDGLPFAPRDTRRESAGRKRVRVAEQHDAEYLGFVASFPCLVCGRKASVHHEPPKSHAGEWHDHKTVPLCWIHHDRHSPQGRHALGLEKFQNRFGLNLAVEVQQLRQLFMESHA